MSTTQQRYTNFKLYGYGLSSSTWRVRIALSAKEIPYEALIDDSLEMNRIGPILEFVDTYQQNKVVRITQSLAIIEFLEFAFPNQGGRLLPLDPVMRAKVKEVVEVIDLKKQPLQNYAVVDIIDVETGEVEKKTLSTKSIENGICITLESMLAPYHSSSSDNVTSSGGPFALGTNEPTLADICMIPQLHNAIHLHGVDDSAYPTLLKIVSECSYHPWFLEVMKSSYGRAMEDLESCSEYS